MSNRCPVCAGVGRVAAFGVRDLPWVIPCPECAGLAITPASADEPAPEAPAKRRRRREVPQPEEWGFSIRQRVEEPEPPSAPTAR